MSRVDRLGGSPEPPALRNLVTGTVTVRTSLTLTAAAVLHVTVKVSAVKASAAALYVCRYGAIQNMYNDI